MSSRYLVAAALLALAGCRANVAGAWATDDDPTARWMLEQERLWAEAACTPNHVTRTLLADDFVGRAPGGGLYTKAENLEHDAIPRTERDCKLLSARVRWFGRDAAVVYGSETATRKDASGADLSRCLVWTDTWLRRDGQWQIVAAQDTTTPCQ
jgi:hypothetical protein